jgi:hypothetical protein
MARNRLAAEGARMTSHEPAPPRWAEAMLRSLLRPSDREPISGDLLEEYRAARRPALGALRANAWYIRHAFSMLWHLIRPYALVLVGSSIVLALTVFRPGHHAVHHAPVTRPMLLSLMVRGLWYGSITGAPGVSLLDALIYFWAGIHGFQRTRLIRAGILAAAATSFVGMTVLFAAAAMITPDLVLAIFVNPLLLLILSAYLLVPLVYAVALGALAGVAGRWLTPGTLSRSLPLNSVHF